MGKSSDARRAGIVKNEDDLRLPNGEPVPVDEVIKDPELGWVLVNKEEEDEG